jgi:tRNA pseudouridine38-40 synthase
MTARLDFEYHGGGFAGWARQPEQRTVQGVLEEALAASGARPELTVAGRTDAGVHALGQVASHPGEPVGAARLNAILPEDVRVLASIAVEDDFDARRDARSRTYRYRVLARPVASPFELGRALHVPRELDVVALERCADLVPGRHVFTAFTPTETDHVLFERNVVRAGWRAAPGGVLELSIEADSFMRHMVRVLVGTMLEVAGGRRTLASFAELLQGRLRSEAGPTAPAQGLYLEAVRY